MSEKTPDCAVPGEPEWETENERVVKWDKEQSRYLQAKLDAAGQAKAVQPAHTPRYTYTAQSGSSGWGDCHFRVTDTRGDDRIATCYIEQNAKEVVRLMNLGLLHPELVAALRIQLFDRQCSQMSDGPHADCICNYCSGCRALAKATEATP